MRDPLHWMPVKHKLSLAFAGLCLLAFGVGGYLISRSARAALEDQIRARIQLQSRASARALDDGLGLLRRRTEDFASDGFLRERFEALLRSDDAALGGELRDELSRHLSVNKLPLVDAFVALTLVSESSRCVVHVGDAAGLPLRGVMERALQVAGPFHSELLVDVDGRDGPLQAIATPLRRLHGGGDVGRLVAWVDTDTWLDASLSGIRPEHPDQTPVVLHVQDRAGHALTPRTDGAGGTVVRSVAVGSMPPPGGLLSSDATLRENGWDVHVRLRDLDAFRPVSGLQSRFLGVGIVLAALCAVLLFFPMRFLVRPLSQLRDAARRIRSGDHGVRVRVDSADEVGDLALAFNHMAEAVEQKTTSLEQAAAELRAGQRELRAQHERLDTVIRTMRDGLVVVDADGRPVLCNAAARPLVTLLESGDERLASHYLCKQRTTERACAGCLLDRDETMSSCVLDVDERVLEVHVTRLPPGPDGRRGRVLLARDITERLTRDERDIHRERLSVLGEVAAVVAHELNNPLTSIRMFAQMLAESAAPGAVESEHLDVILRNTETCRHSIRELLGYATDSAPEAAPVPVHAVLEDVRQFVRPLAERARVRVTTELEASEDVVTGDEIQIRQLFVNLVLNAIQAAPAGVEREGVIVRLATHDDDGGLVVDVIDSGPGLDAVARDRAFDAFFSTKPRGEGTGLGLPTARRIAELHGGGVELVESAPGRTVFRVRLRAHRATPTARVGARP